MAQLRSSLSEATNSTASRKSLNWVYGTRKASENSLEIEVKKLEVGVIGSAPTESGSAFHRKAGLRSSTEAPGKLRVTRAQW